MRACKFCGEENKTPRSQYCSKSCGKKACYNRKTEHYKMKASAWSKANPERRKEIYQEWVAKNPEQASRSAILRRYGLTINDYEELLNKQNGLCASCGTDVPGENRRYFDVDHNHDTGVVRGLLCINCNRGLGFFKDNPARLADAMLYLLERERDSWQKI